MNTVTPRMQAIVSEISRIMGSNQSEVIAPPDGRRCSRRISRIRRAIAHAMRREGFSTLDTAAALGLKAHASVIEMLKQPDPRDELDEDSRFNNRQGAD